MAAVAPASSSLLERYRREALSACNLFASNYGGPIALDPISSQQRIRTKISDEYDAVRIASANAQKSTPAPKQDGPKRLKSESGAAMIVDDTEDKEEGLGTTVTSQVDKAVAEMPATEQNQLVEYKAAQSQEAKHTSLILRDNERRHVKPDWHAPWKLMRVIPGHLGWVRGICVDPGNQWFATGSDDRTIKIWDLASGQLKLTLTGHINSVMGVTASKRHPYLFSCGLDKEVKCWDLEQNKIVRRYHGHLSGVYSIALHPTLDVLVTGGRDSVARVWDMRTKSEVRVLTGHSGTVGSIVCQGTDPQIITGSHDSTIRCWDLIAGKASVVLTNHKKSVRALALHPTEYTFASGSPDNIKVWKCPEASFLRNLSGHNAIINTLSINKDNVLVSGGDNGSLQFWDWKTGYSFQQVQSIPQPGSLDSEAGICASTFDLSGSRLLTCESDKTIKVWKEDDKATPETHPIKWTAPKKRKRY